LREHDYITSLVHQVKKNDVVAMRTLYDKYSKEMLATSYRITNNLQDSEDILQDAFLVSFQKIHQLKEGGKYVGWLNQIVVNKSLAQIKKRVHFKELNIVEDQAEENEENWFEGISFEKIKEAIQELPEGCRQIFSLYLLENYKHKEIAELLGISVSTSKSQYRYALKLLKDKLKNENTLL